MPNISPSVYKRPLSKIIENINKLEPLGSALERDNNEKHIELGHIFKEYVGESKHALASCRALWI